MANPWQTKTITKKGLVLQSKLIAGAVFKLKKAAASSATVPDNELEDLTDLPGIEQLVDIQPPKMNQNGTAKITLQLSNAAVTVPYIVRMIGLWAEDPDEGDILFMVLKDEEGDRVPSNQDMPNASLAWTIPTAYGNAAAVVVEVDPESYVTHEMAGELLDTHNTAPESHKALFDGKAPAVHEHAAGDITVGLLGIARGGTGAATAAAARNALGAAAASHNHNASQITAGTLPIARGGTGAATAAAALNALGAAAASHTHTVAQVTGTLPVNKGGTGATTVAAARNALGLGNTTGALPIANGGTGANSATTALSNLGIIEGTWTPTCNVMTGAISRQARYLRVGNVTFIAAWISGTVSSLSSVQIGGLPYGGALNISTLSVIAHGVAFKDDFTLWGELSGGGIAVYQKGTSGYVYFAPSATGAGSIRIFGWYM